jgi:hypothetical protein
MDGTIYEKIPNICFLRQYGSISPPTSLKIHRARGGDPAIILQGQ